MNARTGWFIVGLIVLSLLALNFPKAAGVIALSTVIVIAVELADPSNPNRIL